MSLDMGYDEENPPCITYPRLDTLLEVVDGVKVLQSHEGLKVNLTQDYSWALEYCARCFSFDNPGEMRLKVGFKDDLSIVIPSRKDYEESFIKKGGLWVNQGEKYPTIKRDKLFFKASYESGTEQYRAFEALASVSSKLPGFINRNK